MGFELNPCLDLWIWGASVNVHSFFNGTHKIFAVCSEFGQALRTPGSGVYGNIALLIQQPACVLICQECPRSHAFDWCKTDILKKIEDFLQGLSFTQRWPFLHAGCKCQVCLTHWISHQHFARVWLPLSSSLRQLSEKNWIRLIFRHNSWCFLVSHWWIQPSVSNLFLFCSNCFNIIFPHETEV